MNRLIIDKGPLIDRVALLENNQLEGLYLEEKTEDRLVGNIYKGRVVNVLPGMQAAFVDIGYRKNGYLYIKDAIPFEERRHGFKDKRIQDYVKEGQEIFVQVTKPPVEDKGPRLTTNLSITGRYSVVSPMDQFVGVSKKIDDPVQRKGLKRLVLEQLPEKTGCVVRTEAAKVDESLILKDLNYLLQVWHRIKREKHLGKTPRLIHQDLSLPFRILRDTLHKPMDVILVNDQDLAEELKLYLKYLMPGLESVVALSDHGPLIFANEGVESQIQVLMNPKVKLQSGGSLIFEETRALTSIDVNSGKYTGVSDLEDTILKTNLEAAEEIMRQIRLRNVSGIIVIDFIDMGSRKAMDRVMKAVQNAAKKDSEQVDVHGFTRLGLLEVSRKRNQNSLLEALYQPCSMCSGTGAVPSETLIANQMLKEVERIASHTSSEAVVFQIDGRTHHYIQNQSMIRAADIQRLYHLEVQFDVRTDNEHCFYKLKFMGRNKDVGKFLK